LSFCRMAFFKFIFVQHHCTVILLKFNLLVHASLNNGILLIAGVAKLNAILYQMLI